VAARLLLATFFFYFMLALSFRAALRTNLLPIAAYAVAALLGKIAPTVAAYSLFVLYANRVAFLERRRLAEVAAHDGLTGPLNRAALQAQARSLWLHARLGGLPVSVLLIDIDHFKAYNDHYGHPAGDRCLREVATAIAGLRAAGHWISLPAMEAKRSSPSSRARIAPRRPRRPPTCCARWRNWASLTMARAHARF